MPFTLSREQLILAMAPYGGRRNGAGRPGGAVSLAVGIARIFTGLPGMRGLMDYWYRLRPACR